MKNKADCLFSGIILTAFRRKVPFQKFIPPDFGNREDWQTDYSNRFFNTFQCCSAKNGSTKQTKTEINKTKPNNKWRKMSLRISLWKLRKLKLAKPEKKC